MMDLLFKAAEITAKYKLLLIYHGCPKPVGLNRTFPNIMSYEAIKGLEYVSTGIVGAYDMIDYNVIFKETLFKIYLLTTFNLNQK